MFRAPRIILFANHCFERCVPGITVTYGKMSESSFTTWPVI